MIRIIALLSPVYICLFWAIVLAVGNEKTHSTPRAFLGRFMLLPMAVYFTHFLYFAPLPDIYPYFDALFCYTSLFVFPMYYVYFRLLTVDKKFSLKVHGKYFVVALIVGTLYSVGVLLAPKTEYKVWLYNQTAFADLPQIKFLASMRILGKVTYLIQVLLTVIGNFILIRKYEAKAEQYYSDIKDGKNTNARILNYSIILMSITAFIIAGLGRYEINSDTYILPGWAVFSVILFVIGYMGIKQNPINPAFEPEEEGNESIPFEIELNFSQKVILQKLIAEFDKEKIYLNSQLNIMDVVQKIGTNRTYISSIINQQYNQNFCAFVNSYRLVELERVLTETPSLSNALLAEKCGFGSVNSMKRVISNKSGDTIEGWKKKVFPSNLM